MLKNKSQPAAGVSFERLMTKQYPRSVTDMRIAALGILQTQDPAERANKAVQFQRIYDTTPQSVVDGMSNRTKQLCRKAGNL